MINVSRTCCGLLDVLNLYSFFNISAFSCKLLRDNFNNQGLSDFCPKQKALVMDTLTPK